MQATMLPTRLGAARTRAAAGARPPLSRPLLPARRVTRRPVTTPAALPDPSIFLTLADAMTSASDAVSVVADAAATAAAPAIDAAAPAASNSGGWLAPFANAFEAFLKVLDSGLEAAHVPYSYGFAIIALTIIVKLATYPLTKKQMASTIALQALQPQVKAIQARYQGRPPEEAQVEVARLYKEAGVNPLAGCLPTLVTLPVWIGLYRALSNVADEGLLKEGWFWIPSLAGPTSLAAQKAGAGTSWLFPLVDGAPPIGWPSATAYLILPVLLVVSQAVTQRLMSPPPAEGDSSAQSTQAILKFLPLMIGWFSLNVPAGLTLYWFTNNLLSTAQQAYLKASLNPAGAGAGAGAGGGGGGMGGMMGGGASSPSSFTNASGQQRGPVVQAEAVDAAPARPTGQDLNARRSAKQLDARGEKFRALKAKEAAKKAAAQAGGGATLAQAEPARKAGAVATDPSRPVVPNAAPSKGGSGGGEA